MPFLSPNQQGKGNVDCIQPIQETPLRCSGIACIVKGYYSFTCTPCISPTSGSLCLSAAAGTHLPTQEGWKAE